MRARLIPEARAVVRMVVLVAVAAAPLSAGTQGPQAPEVAGYGPWRFGMSLAEVESFDEHAPYEPVRASMGGVETRSGMFEAGVEKVSFVFNANDQLYDIRVWYEVGDTYDEALVGFHRAYLLLVERFGDAHMDNRLQLDADLDVGALAALLPAGFAPSGDEKDVEESVADGSVRTTPQRVILAPMRSLGDAEVVVLFVTVPPTTLRVVTMYYRGSRYTPTSG